MQSGNKCNVAGRVDGWRAAENRAVVVLTNLADAQIGVHHVTLAGHARQVIAVADINGLAIFVAGTKGHQSVVIDGRRKEVQFQNGAFGVNAGNFGGHHARIGGAEPVDCAGVVAVEVYDNGNIAVVVERQAVVKAGKGRVRIGCLVGHQQFAVIGAVKQTDLVVVVVNGADLDCNLTVVVAVGRVNVDIGAVAVHIAVCGIDLHAVVVSKGNAVTKSEFGLEADIAVIINVDVSERARTAGQQVDRVGGRGSRSVLPQGVGAKTMAGVVGRLACAVDAGLVRHVVDRLFVQGYKFAGTLAPQPDANLNSVGVADFWHHACCKCNLGPVIDCRRNACK